MEKLRDLHKYLLKNNIDSFKPVVNIDRICQYLIDNKDNRIFYNINSDDWKIKIRIKCVKDDNVITFLDEPIYMDLFAKSKRDVLSIINSRMS